MRRIVDRCFQFRIHLLQRRARQAATGLLVPSPAELDPNVRYLKCPQCQNLMNRMNYANRSGIVINVCRRTACGSIAMKFAKSLNSSPPADLIAPGERKPRNSRKPVAQTSSIDEFQSGVLTSAGLFNNSFNADERYQLLTGVASISNHFLGR